MNGAASPPPGRVVLRLAGVLTQLIGASGLLLGTIAFVLVQQNRSGGTGWVIAWAVAAMVALVLGGLMARGGLVSVLGSAVLDAGFGVVLLALDEAVLRALVTVLPASDVDMIAAILVGAGGAMLAVAVLCLGAIPQALRHVRWLQARASAPVASPGELFEPQPGATSKGWAPPTARISVWSMPAASPDDRRSRRRLYFSLAGFAVGFGAGIGLLVAMAAQDDAAPPLVAAPGSGTAGAAGSGSARTAPDGGVVVAEPIVDVPIGDGPVGEGGAIEDQPSVQRLIAAQRTAIERADVKALVAMLAPTAFGFGIDADEVAVDRDAIAAQLARDLGEAPADGYAVDLAFTAVGEVPGHAWIALELVLSAPERATRRIAITELAAFRDGRWTVVAWHWAVPVPDATAERTAILGTLPRPAPVANRRSDSEDLVAAVRTALGSRAAFAAARSERADGFNFGSAPGERVVGGRAIKKLFGRLQATIRLRDGVRVVDGGAWDPAQAAAPTIAYAAANVDFTTKTKAATELTQTFRVLAILVKEDGAWKLVSTQWSHGGPIR